MKKIVLALTILTLGFAGLSAQTMTGRELAEKIEDSQDVESAAMDITMTLIDKNGSTSERHLQTLTMDDGGINKSIMIFKAPASVANTRFLTIENEGRNDDQWIYLPSLRKIKRIASGERSGSFMGSDFSYSDMETQELDDYEFKILGEESVGSYDCWILQGTVKDEEDYSRIVTWVDKGMLVPVKAELFEAGSDQLIKTTEMAGYSQIDGIWTPRTTTMTTLESGHKTVMTTNKVKYGIRLNPSFFTTNYLQTGRN